MTSHHGLRRTYYKSRQGFFIRNLYKYLHLYIMSYRVCSARRDIPFKQKQHIWSSQVIHDFAIMESISMDLNVMPTSFHGYNYLLVMRCNHSHLLDRCTFSLNMTNSCTSYLQAMGMSLSGHFTCHVSNKVFWDCQMANLSETLTTTN